MNASDSNVVETDERFDALEAVRACRGSARACDWVSHLVDAARREGSYLPRSLTTTHKNTISPEQQEKSPADRTIEHRLRSIIRRKAPAIIVGTNKESSELGGHIASSG